MLKAERAERGEGEPRARSETRAPGRSAAPSPGQGARCLLAALGVGRARMVTERGSSARRQLGGGPAAMGTVELKDGANAVAINLLLIVRPERKGQRDGVTDGAGKASSQGGEGCRRRAGFSPGARSFGAGLGLFPFHWLQEKKKKTLNFLQESRFLLPAACCRAWVCAAAGDR